MNRDTMINVLYVAVVLSSTVQTRYNADVGIHNITPRYKWVALYWGILLRNKWYTVMTKNIYFHDNVMFILKTSPGLTVSVLVYSFPCDLSYFFQV